MGPGALGFAFCTLYLFEKEAQPPQEDTRFAFYYTTKPQRLAWPILQVPRPCLLH